MNAYPRMPEEYDDDCDDEYYDNEYDPSEDDDNFCGEKGCFFPAYDQCQCCGCGLCVMHSETGCGFCLECPTREWIDEQNATTF